MTGTCRLNFWRPSITIELINIKHRMQKSNFTRQEHIFWCHISYFNIFNVYFQILKNNENTIFIEKIRKAQQ